MSRTARTDKLIADSGQRIRLFIYNVRPNSNKRKTLNSLNSLNEYFVRDISLNVDFFNESPEEIICQLYNSKFVAYASIIIIINRYEALSSRRICKLFNAMENNRYLRYKSKLLLMLYNIDGSDEDESVVLNSYFDFLEDVDLNGFLYPIKFERKTNKEINEDINRTFASVDYEDFQNSNLDNCILVQIFMPKKIRYGYTVDEIFYEIFMQPFVTMQTILLENIPFQLRRRIVKTSSNSDLYFYAINPALAIIINNYYFTSSGLSVREGSEKDAAHLVRILKLSGIPYILIEDCNLAELKQIFNYLATKVFQHIKSLFLFLMSHGDDNNVFYTNDGELNIKSDIVERIQSNPSLKEIQKFFIVNACRGSIDLEFDMDNVVESLNLRTGSNENFPNLMENTALLYSVPDGVQSPRSHILGSPLIQSLCQHFTDTKVTDNVKNLNHRINKDLSQLLYYDGLEQCSDLVLSDAYKYFPILNTPTKFLEMSKFIDSIAQELPGSKKSECTKMLSRFLYVCGIINFGKYPSIDAMKNKYFAPDLEYEDSDVDMLPKHLFQQNN